MLVPGNLSAWGGAKGVDLAFLGHFEAPPQDHPCSSHSSCVMEDLPVGGVSSEFFSRQSLLLSVGENLFYGWAYEAEFWESPTVIRH